MLCHTTLCHHNDLFNETKFDYNNTIANGFNYINRRRHIYIAAYWSYFQRLIVI